MATSKQPSKPAYTKSDLAAILDITPDQAQALMTRESFPATEVAPGAYVVAPDLLQRWVDENARRVEGVNLFKPTSLDDILANF